MTTYLVNRVASTQLTKTAQIGERIMPATVDVLEVELSHEAGEQGTIMLRFFEPEAQASARTMYVQGENVDVEITPVATPAPTAKAA